ncbi:MULTISPECIES: pyridoxamine 5'-phosphate oxidase family protein [unclassified Mycolicibacterium]|uniref:pyridoxamine 5'-phosphate oxidase family protein n=1 Tax=unclassified Mycolicibacterium TaxID=2636767 RepID=UPI0012DC1AD8|nr:MULTISPECIES: pyridoxamine 5'-phosphate oxidase family protein [unclassified Mycolicibacterium]MUL81649.1 pyridoxamine 5'-phosphate oxidase family protein [Mycolicibacterium sp. CBMA 329]MUL87415.1 pyridoxamine 5'-phosphate oxidase family protein [Mycolicibacterium sp. CBMA 331]MUL99719.1 pyridoxamine 5'-phosphate oxidase family protein [Mycolicibacterium sp. CBMA 334]MUM25370.1 pyridoxamine 5'-phosphate oxidase family protein [Mycolicibacterium sp. CBMA 295]MUM37712.1 pyridoxamine 5'-phosp
MTITGKLDQRFSEATEPTSWRTAAGALDAAGLYWLTTVRGDGRPHVTPLVGVWTDGAFAFCTGSTEQKARNLQTGEAVVVTTGINTWNAGLDVVVEGTAARVTGRDRLTVLADAYRTKYGDDWDFDCDDEVFDPQGEAAIVFQVTPAKVITFAKSPHGQTTFRF